jgi:AcrR family transcriptional regulator
LTRIDSETRRRALGEALWRVVLREGIEAASVRKVAAEAGVSKGSLRHVFPSQSELLTFAMQLIHDEVTRRVAAVEASGDVRDMVERHLQSLLVLDPETRAVIDVWLAFAARARVDPSLRPLRDETHAQVRDLCRRSLETLRDQGRTRPELDLGLETERLHALIDGLAMHATLDPEITTPARQLEILSQHLDTLA